MNWINVKDKLPIKNTEVVVICFGSCWLAELKNDGKWQDTQNSFTLDEVTYWLPLPKLPNNAEGI